MKTELLSLPENIVSRIESLRDVEHGNSYLIAILQDVQTHFGYLPKECLDEVAQRMQIPTAKVSGVATFYHFFTFKPKGKYKVTLCMGTACFVRGAEQVLARFCELLGIEVGETTTDGLFSVECARCLGACALAPIVLVNDRVYGNVTPDQVSDILAEYGFTPEAAKTGEVTA